MCRKKNQKVDIKRWWSGSDVCEQQKEETQI